jgi:hypothetical protein
MVPCQQQPKCSYKVIISASFQTSGPHYGDSAVAENAGGYRHSHTITNACHPCTSGFPTITSLLHANTSERGAYSGRLPSLHSIQFHA